MLEDPQLFMNIMWKKVRVLPLLPMIVRESMLNSGKSYDNMAYALKLGASDFKEEGVVFEGCKYVVKRMSELGIDLIEISGGNYEAPVFDGEYESGVGFVTYAVVLADLTSVPIVSTGGFRRGAQMEEAIEEGVSMIGLARPFVLRPSLVNDYREVSDLQLSTPRLTTSLPKLDKALGSIIGISYYEAQIKFLAKGRSVKIS